MTMFLIDTSGSMVGSRDEMQRVLDELRDEDDPVIKMPPNDLSFDHSMNINVVAEPGEEVDMDEMRFGGPSPFEDALKDAAAIHDGEMVVLTDGMFDKPPELIGEFVEKHGLDVKLAFVGDLRVDEGIPHRAQALLQMKGIEQVEV